MAERLSLSEETRGDVALALVRIAVLVPAAVFSAVPSVVMHPSGIAILEDALVLTILLVALATIPLTLLEGRLVRRGTGLPLALGMAVLVWLYVWIAIIAARLESLYTLAILDGHGLGGAFERLRVELQWMRDVGPSDGASQRTWGPATRAAVTVARIPMFFAPTIAAVFFTRVARARRSRFVAWPLALLLLGLFGAVHVPIADALPPFTYKFPGWNGTKQVIDYCIWAEIFGLAGMAAGCALADRLAPRVRRWWRERRASPPSASQGEASSSS